MKKYLMGVTAIVLAISLFAFSTINKADKKKDHHFATYFWYPVDATGKTTGSSLNPGTARDKTYALVNLTSCTDVATKPYCILGSSSNNLSSGTQISSPPVDATILKTN